MSETAESTTAAGDGATPDHEGSPDQVADPEALEYSDLQEVAKHHGVKANLPREDLVRQLREEGALGTGDDDATPVTTSSATSDTEVLEFTLGGERYCLDITHVSEIVDGGEITSVPGTGDHVAGVMDLRGTTTQIVNPKRVLEVADETPGDRVVVIELRDSNVGWLVDEAHRVTALDGTDVDDTIADGPVDGVVHRDDGFVVLLDPVAVSTAEN
jgi:purine-binding chemotaxis protein CheW